MNRLLRGTLYGTGMSLPIWGLVLAFFVAWWWIPIMAGMVLLIVVGLWDWIGRDRGDDDAWYVDRGEFRYGGRS